MADPKEPNPLRMGAAVLGSEEPYLSMADEVWQMLPEKERDTLAAVMRPLIDAHIEQMRRSLPMFLRMLGRGEDDS